MSEISISNELFYKLNMEIRVIFYFLLMAALVAPAASETIEYFQDYLPIHQKLIEQANIALNHLELMIHRTITCTPNSKADRWFRKKFKHFRRDE